MRRVWGKGKGLQNRPPKVSRKQHAIKLPVLREAVDAESWDPVGHRLPLAGVLKGY